jgi:hypothetical protein
MKTLNHAQTRLLVKTIKTCSERWPIESISKLIEAIELVKRQQSWVRRISTKLIEEKGYE